MKALFIFFPILLFINSCSSIGQRSSRKAHPALIASKKNFQLNDKTGDFLLVRESGFQRKSNSFVLKTKLTPSIGDKSKVLEQSVSIAKIGTLKKIPLLRPSVSQYIVWFDKKKYFTQLKVLVDKKSLEITMKSPERKWNGVKVVPFPKGTGAFCFYSQIIECAGVTGFINKSIDKKVGTMNFTVIWDGYPYFQEQYINIPNQVFSDATLSYDGEDAKGGHRFTLSIVGQQVFYTVDDYGRYFKQFWVSQGLSINKSGD